MEKLLFIINPVAGGNRAKELIPLIEETMKKNNLEYKLVQTTKPEEATEFAEDLEYKNVIAVGGDGTINEVAKGLIRRRSGRLGIIPSGTGNDLSKSLNLPKDSKEALDIIVRGETIEIDTGIANDHEFLNIASIGFDAQVVEIANKIKKKIKIKGKFAYILGVLHTLLSYKRKDLIIDIDGTTYKRSIVLMALGNGNYYGGGMKVLPYASLNDGDLHICMIKDMSNFKILFLFPTIFRGKHLKFRKYVETLKGKSIKINFQEDTCFNLDGDIFCGNKNLQLNISNYKLEVFK